MKLIEKRVCEKFASRNRERPGGGTRKGGMVLVGLELVVKQLLKYTLLETNE